MDRHDLDLRMGAGENTEHFVGERLTYLLDIREVQQYGAESIDPHQDTPRLGA